MRVKGCIVLSLAKSTKYSSMTGCADKPRLFATNGQDSTAFLLNMQIPHVMNDL